MKITRKKIINNRSAMIIAIIVGFLIITVYTVLSDINHTNESVERFDYFVRNEMNEIVRNEVLDRIDEIEYDLSILNEEQNEIIKNKIHMMGNILTGSDLVKIENMQKRKSESLRELKRIAKVDKEYSYFALSRDGELLYSGIDDSVEGKNLLDTKDENGVYYIKEMLKSIDEPEGLYVTYSWPKEKDGESLKKTSFCSYIPKLDMIIGTGYYEVQIQKALREATFSRIQSYYEDSEDYIFIVGYDGIARVFADSSLIGKDVKDIMDKNGRPIHDLFMETIRTNKEGYVNYSYYRKNSNKISEKIAYVKALDEWQAYIAMGFHIDDLNEELDTYIDDLNMEYYKELILTMFLLVCIALIILYFVRRSLLLQSKYMYQEEIVFEQLFQLSSEGILIVSNKGNIMFHNPIIDKIFGENLEEYIDEKGQLNIDIISENICKVENDNGKTYYIESNCKSMIYHNVDSYIYFILDITSKFSKSNELERMALYDELTNLPNRRKLLDDFEQMMEDNTNEHSIVLAIIDLDHFKNVNDKYGHNIGDEVLKLLSEFFTTKLGNGDNIYRHGGEEFVVLLKNTTLEDGQTMLASICNDFSQYNEEKLGFPLTFSGGATKVESDSDRDSCLVNLLSKADKLLYQAKNKGRSRIEIHLEKDKPS